PRAIAADGDDDIRLAVAIHIGDVAPGGAGFFEQQFLAPGFVAAPIDADPAGRIIAEAANDEFRFAVAVEIDGAMRGNARMTIHEDVRSAVGYIEINDLTFARIGGKKARQ